MTDISNALTDDQLTDLARSLKSSLLEFYSDPQNLKDYEEWLQKRSPRTGSDTTVIN